ncbi:MAG: glycine cleavage system aminomethyltransferase GcvT [Pirellulaceae bacterium]
MSLDLAKTPLHDWHVAAGGRMVDFTGWSMPVQYNSIVEEHRATRTAVGLFDVSHMARFRFEGPEAEGFLNRLLTRRVDNLKPGRIRYSVICREDGGILDDVLIYRLAEEDGTPYFWLVVNAGNRTKIAAWIQKYLPSSGVEFTDRTLETAMIAVQGPKALEIAQEQVSGGQLADFPYFSGQNLLVDGQPALISRTGYTGEDGCEITIAAEHATPLWQRLADAAAKVQGMAVGLGARDTLRLEAAMPLYGHELSEEINPIQAGLEFAVSAGREFLGSEAIEKAKGQADLPRRVGLQMEGRRVPREHYPIIAEGRAVGEVTSGTFSPTLDCPIAMGYVPPQYATVGTSLEVDLRGKLFPAKVVELPFYKR